MKIIETINKIRRKDPDIYQKDTKWFSDHSDSDASEDSMEEEADAAAGGRKKKKFKDVLREQLLKGGADGDDGKNSRGRDSSKFAYDEEQERIRKEFLQSANGAIDDNENEEDRSVGGILKTKATTANADSLEDEQKLQAALDEMRALGKKSNVVEDTGNSDPSSAADEFLSNYIAKKLWQDRSSKGRTAASQDDDLDYEEEEKELEQVDNFESKYNFRFEELEGSGAGDQSGTVGMQVVGHARNIRSVMAGGGEEMASLRRVDDKRKLQRESRKERKEKEKRQKEEEIKRLKNLKKQEV